MVHVRHYQRSDGTPVTEHSRSNPEVEGLNKKETEQKLADISKPKKQADEVLARELTLYWENDGELYQQFIDNYVKYLDKKVKKGDYDRKKAVKLMEYFLSNYVRPKYEKDFGKINVIDKATKEAFAEECVETYERDFMASAENY